jgi:hypothetical protein
LNASRARYQREETAPLQKASASEFHRTLPQVSR